jgi:hypothetical protein
MTRRRARLAAISTSIALAAGVAIAALPAAAAAAGQETADQAAASAAPASPGVEPGTLTGSPGGVLTGVIRGPDGLAVRGACVTAAGPDGTVTRLTAADGRYAIAGLRPGRYRVGFSDCASPARYFDQWYGGAGMPGGADLSSDARPVTVEGGPPVRLAPATLRLTSPVAEVAAASRAGQAGSSAAIPAARAGVISGTVRSRSGRRLDGVCTAAAGHAGGWVDGFREATGSKGGYSFPVGTSGTWVVEFSGGCGNAGSWAPQWWRNAPSPRQATRLHEKKGRGFSRVDGVLRPGAAISGTVTAADGGQPLSGVCVTATGTGAMRQVQVQARTGSGGRYVARDLGTGSYRLRFSPDCGAPGSYLSATIATAVKATDGKTTAGIDAALKPGASISGAVTSQATGTPVANMCVTLVHGYDEQQLPTGKNGGYTFTGLRAGRYEVGFSGGCGNSGSYAPQSYDGQATAAGATAINLAAGQAAAGISASLAPGGTLTGQLRGTSGRDLRGSCVMVTGDETAYQGELPFPSVVLDAEQNELYFTNGSGRYRAPNLEPGRYQVIFNACGAVSGTTADAAFAPQGGAGWISVRPGATTSGVGAILPVGGTISGRLTRPSGHPQSGACVAAYPASQPTVSQVLEFANVSRSGKYTVRGLATGRYAVQFSPCLSGSFSPQWYDGSASFASARLVRARDGHPTTGISMRIASGGTVEGKIVTAASGTPVAGACVFLADAANLTYVGAATGHAGTYRITHVLPGRWTATILPCGTNASLGAITLTERVRGARLTSLATIRMPRAGQLTGSVTGGTGPAAQPGVCVTALPVSGDAEPGATLTGPDGSYDLTGLAPGSYRVQFSPYCLLGTAALVPQWYEGAASKAAAKPVSVTGGQVTSDIGATMTSDGGISGTVTASSAAVSGVCVGAYAGSAKTPAEIAITGTNGSYQLAGLAPGTYTVKFTGGCGNTGYPAQWYDGVKTRPAATPVSVSADHVTVGIDAS